MRIRGRIPDAESPWDEIVPLLWMGGHYYRDPSGVRRPVIVGKEFGLVLSLCERPDHGPAATVEHHLAEIPDGPLTPDQLADVCRLADLAIDAVRSGRRVLVRCASGYNCSGLVIAQYLVSVGYSTSDAILIVRRRRSKWALNNALFVD